MNLEERLLDVYRRQDNYKSLPAIKDAMGDVAMTAVVGPIAAGKNFLMQRSGLHIVGTETSRRPKPEDDEHYRYATVEDMLAAIDSGEYVQYGAAPPNIYASRPDDYEHGFPNISDIWADAVFPLSSKGFESIRTVGILTPVSQWRSQLWQRLREGSVSREIFPKRLDESRYSIRWSLAQRALHPTNHFVIVNDAEQTAQNVDLLREFASGNDIPEQDDELISRTATDMLKFIPQLYTNAPREIT